MARCGCSGSTCGCKVVAGHGVVIRGSGSTISPYVVDAYPLSLEVQDSTSIDLHKTGSGTPGDPYILSADITESGFDSRWQRWEGTQTEYNALGAYDTTTLYLITGP